MGQLRVQAQRWFPGIAPDEDVMAEAMWLEKQYWLRMEISVANGIAKAFKGR